MKRYGLIGYPLHHSFSENYFMNKFRNEKVDAVYNNFPIKTIAEFPDLIKKYPDLNGLNVTHPYKASIINYMDDIDNAALKANAVNVIHITRKGSKRTLKGFNTDTDGFVLSLKPLIDNSITKALVLGTGGASRAVQAGLERLGIDCSVVSRNKIKADLGYADLTGEFITDYRLIINATPLGMYPDTTSAPDIPYESLGKGCILFDLVYNPPESLFLKRGKERACTIKNGMEMLHIQAEKTWEIWTSCFSGGT
ncbi:MAG TPA: shikimate dehydrogenase [Bacteroidetes bacterium]|nr:shikimate dehydrogenase [Bacteroidota bacterium]